MKTFIPGKDAALEDSITRMQTRLQELGFDIEEASWLNPVPHVWSVHIRDRDCPMCFTNGKGSSRKAALASALGEYFERLANNYFFADWYLGKEHTAGDFTHYPNEKWFAASEEWPANLLDEHSRKIYDPENELTPADLYDRGSGNPDKGICALPYVRQSDNQQVFIPVNVIGNLYVSNGMSAGNTATEASVQCLSEIFERYVKNKIIAEGLTLPDIPEEVLQRYPQVVEAVAQLRQHGFAILLKDASLGGKYPVINVTLVNPEDGGVFPSFGAHPQFGVALERTLTELLQGRDLDQLNVFEKPSFDLDVVATAQNLEEHFIDSNGLVHWRFFADQPDFAFADWNFSAGSTEEEWSRLLGILHHEGHQVYVADHQHLGVYACRIHVPGVSEIYPFEDLKWNNNNDGVRYRQALLNLPGLNQAVAEEIYQALDEEDYPDTVPVGEFVGVVGDPGSVWSELRLGELKARLSLFCGNLEQAQEHTAWLLNFGQLSGAREKTWRCIEAILGLQLGDNQLPQFQQNLPLMFGEELYAKAQRMVAGEQTFADLPATDDSLQGFELHQKLLKAYGKLQRAKAQLTY